MTPEQDAPAFRDVYVNYTACIHGLPPGEVRLDHDEHGAAFIYLNADGHMSIRIQLDIGRYDTPEQHAADLERDRQGLLRLAAVAAELAEEIAEEQREGGAQ